ncbi:MAG: extradiol dioxygenase [Chloroflexi bacterium]|nr:extradiol dioxygenase [Chloroflexota bacterium]
MITGMHVAINSDDAQAVQAFLRDKLDIPSYDAGGGFLIFEPPAAEIACGSASATPYGLHFICDDIDATMQELAERGVTFASEVHEESWGRVTEFTLPDGRSVGLYEPKYSRAKPIGPV